MVEVAHDMSAPVAKYVAELKLTNSYDTWHGDPSVTFMCGVFIYFFVW